MSQSTENSIDSKRCPKCKEDILWDAVKCKHCWADLRNRFVRHKIVTVILWLFILWAIFSDWNWWKTKDTVSTWSVAQQTLEKAIKEEEKKEIIINKETCNSVKSWMSKEKVMWILWEPSTTSESETSWLWTSEMMVYSKFMKSCTIFISNWKVSTRSWTEL